MAATQERKEVITQKCYGCKNTMQGSRRSYRYDECGLDNVILKNIVVFVCSSCGAVVPEIPAIGDLHRTIASRLIHKPTLLAGQEIRFLRKMAGMTSSELATALGADPTSLCKWETGKRKPTKKTDASIRLISLAGMLQETLRERDLVPTVSEVAKSLSEVDIKSLLAQIKETSTDPIEVNIDPSNLSQLGGFEPGQQKVTEVVQ